MTASAVDPRSDVLSHPLRLRDDVERLEGAEGSRMLFTPTTGRYVRIGKQAHALLDLFDGTRTGEAVVVEVARRLGTRPEPVRDRITVFVLDLRQAGLLDGLEPVAEPRRARLAKGLHATRTKRFPLVKASRLLARPAHAVSRWPLRTLGPALATLCVLAGATGTMVLFLEGLPLAPPPLLPMVALLIAQIFVHETAHAFVLNMLKVPPREAGIALWYYIIPIAYVDRTDSYRIHSRAKRFAVSAAGPLVDMLWILTSAVVLTATTGTANQLAHSLLYTQVTMLVFNFNPFLPSDGQQAAETLIGDLNMRGRAMTYIAHRVLRTPLPSYLRGLSRRRRLLYLGYGSLCIAYLAVLVLFLVAWAILLVRFV